MSRRTKKRTKATEVQAPALPLDTPKPTRDLGGRKSKFSDEVMGLFVDAILKGAGREDAAEAAGIHPATFRRWMADAVAEDASEEMRAFRAAVEGAERQLVLKCSEGMVDLTREDVPPAVRFAALKLILQSRRPNLWRPAKEVSISAPGGGPVQVDVSGDVEAKVVIPWEKLGDMTPEQLEAFMRAMVAPE